MNGLQTFTNAAFGKVRILYEDGKPLFCGADACKALGYSNQWDALKRHCRYLVKREVPNPQSASKKVTMNFLPEGDLYRLITHSKLPSAEKFERWVFDEVLPTLRQTGQYGADPAELERLRHSNAVLRDWLDLLAARKRDLVELQQECEKVFGALPLAGRNLFDRARVRFRAQRLGCTSVSLTNGRLIYQGVEVPRTVALKLKERGALVYPKTHKVAYPFHRNEEEVMPAALGVLEEIGGDDEVDE